ncbi:MAG TPA: class I SAM-dependent methyltransferase [Candidatus Limnocylindrales bacterium]|nr:class I SAM-dependent methyltransferase [Candidatus Limnocylindrales bacterium]
MSNPTDPADPKGVVARGYDKIARRYLEWSALRPSPARRHYLELACARIPPGSTVLELGCGAGLPMTKALADGRDVTGVDISATQIALARRNVPGATFIQSDMTTLAFDDARFDAVVAFYSLTHVPREELPGLLGRIRRWLRRGGILIATMGVEDDPGGIEKDWLGVDMYFSHFSARKNRRLVEAAGFAIEEADVVAEPEDRHGARFLWIVAVATAALVVIAACQPGGATPSPAAPEGTSPGATVPGIVPTPALEPSPVEPGFGSPVPSS